MRSFFPIALFVAILLGACATPEKTTVQYKSERGAKPYKLSLDIYNESAGAKRPVVVFVHGGGWMLGDKATKIKNKVALFKKFDYVFVSVNYRLSSLVNKKVQYPQHTNDVADAVRWIYNNIGQYGGDKNNMVLMGHSAGAQMISLLATSDKFLPERGIQPTVIKGIISMDTEGYNVYGMGVAGAKIYQKIFGTDTAKWKEASPVLQVTPGKKYPDFLIVMRGKPYRIEMAGEFAEKLRSAGADVQLIKADPYSHFKVNNIFGSEKDTIVTPVVVAFLKKAFSEK